jgi:seryl-tRNA synthetase
MNSLSSISRKLALPLVLLLLVAGSGCKSKKKAMEAAAAEQARIEQEAAAKKQKDEQERKRQEELAEAERLSKEKADREAKTAAPSMQLDGYFNAIVNSSSPTAANGTIQEALTLFATEDAPVLIVISESGGIKDYDRPTTIKAYLNYLKDVKKNTNRISNLQFNSANKIVEVELVKDR